MMGSATMKGVVVSGIEKWYQCLVYAGAASQLLNNRLKKLNLGHLLGIVIDLSPTDFF